MDKVFVKNAKYQANLGVTETERSKKQEILIDFELIFDTRKSAETDNIDDTVDYSVINKKFLEFFETNEDKLIEKLGQKLVEIIFSLFQVEQVRLAVKKPAAIANAEYSGIEIVRKKN